MVNVTCNYCGTLFLLNEYSYEKRKRASKNKNLFCSRQCSGKAKKRIVITTAQQDLDEWFGTKPTNLVADDIIIGVGLSTTNNNMGGTVILSSEESNVMAREDLVNKAVELGQTNPMFMDMTLTQIVKHLAEEKTGEEVEVSNATPIIPAPTIVPAPTTVITPAPTTVVTPVQSNPTTPVQSNSVTVWQGRLDDKTALRACDAKFHDEARTMRMCNPDPESGGRYLYHIVDPIDGLQPTPTKKLCFRCQGSGTMTLRNLGYNWKTDIEYGNIHASVSFSEYVASKNINNLPVILPAENTLPQYKDSGNRQAGFSAL